MRIFTITTIDIDDLSKSRCVGFFLDGIEAIEKVENNASDLREAGYYTHAVIEGCKEGLYPFISPRLFYKWNGEKKKFVRCEEPRKVKQLKLANFGIG